MSTLRITYDGPALTSHEMEVRQLAPALHAIGDLLEHANRVLSGADSKVSVSVKGSFKTGSFGIDLVLLQGWVRGVVDMFNTREAVAILGLLSMLGLSGKDAKNGLIGVIKWLRGRTLTQVVKSDSRATLYVDDDALEIELQVLQLLMDIETRRALDGVIREPLARDGVDVFASGTDSAIEVTVTHTESFWFAAPEAAEQTISETESEERLQLVAVVFKDDNKWRFSDGASAFYAAILDDVFLSRVDKDEERFGKNDIFRVLIKRRHYLDAGGVLRQEVSILEVIEHTPAARQIRLPLL
ncbi:MAG: hypothetical protein Q7U37_07905 [Gallionella sp.]|nr:hypothetical protein [Gallionella sp.]